MEYPCKESCISYAICLQRIPSEKVKHCSIYEKFIKDGISEKQKLQERGFQVVAITTPDGLIDEFGYEYERG